MVFRENGVGISRRHKLKRGLIINGAIIAAGEKA